MRVEDSRSIGIEFCRIRSGGHAEFIGMIRLYPMKDGFGVYVRDAQPHGESDFHQVRGFVACDPNEDIWRLIEKAVAWAAGQMKRQ
jgi:hypothetical protein